MAHNPFRHNQTMHIEVNYHIIKEKLDGGWYALPIYPYKDRQQT